MENIFYVTTPIYYVNAEPHLGHAYSTILADFQKRFYSMLGYDSYFLTGTDEHGDKIADAAEQNNTTPQQYSDRISGLFREAWKNIGISNDDFIRTTDEKHKKVVKEILQKVYDNGDIYFGSYGGNYCVGCERFLTDKELVDGKCPEHNREPEYIEEKNYFFKMGKYQKWLIEYIDENPDFIRPERYRNEVISLLKNDALEDLCISRPKTRLSWGIELPFDSEYVTYVWFDALINYMSAIDFPDGEKFKKYWPHVNHIIAKDILKPHGIFWPTMLKSAGIEPYKHLNVHGYWNMEDMKMSKSLGNVITPESLVEEYGNDQIRYFLLREMTFGNDARFSSDLIIDRINYDLANDLGNLINRTFNMVNKYFEGKIPELKSSAPAEKEEVAEKLKSAATQYIEYNKTFQTSVAIEKLWEFVRFLNRYIDTHKPWQLAKEEKTDELASVMRNLLESIYSVAVLLDPILINISPVVIKALGAEGKSYDIGLLHELNNLTAGTVIGETGILFPKIEREKKKPEGKKEAGKESKKEEKKEVADDGLIDIKEFGKVDIRVAEVLSAEKVEGSDKLLELRVNAGADERVIIAGLALHYTPDYLVGKKILLVANLKPAKIFKRKSHGMLLAAKESGDSKPVLIEVDQAIPVGARLG